MGKKKEYDIVIIGGGLGGLTSGALLSKKGKKVLLLEQHSVVGGCATTFKRKGFRVEAGLHEMDGFGPTDIKKPLFKKLGIFEKVKFVKLPDFYRYRHGDYDITIPSDKKEAIKILSKSFPEEKDGIKKFITRIVTIHRQINLMPQTWWKMLLVIPIFPLLYWAVMISMKLTVADLIDKLITNEELKLILTANLQYYHDDPYSMSLLYFGAAQGGYFDGGSYFIKGGSQKLSNALADIITENGGAVKVKSLVTNILVENSRAVGVEYHPTSAQNSDDNTTVFAENIIANSAIPTVISKLIPKNYRHLFSSKYDNLQIAPSLITIFIGLKNRSALTENRVYSTFYIPKMLSKLKDVNESYKGSVENRTYSFVDYSLVDSSLADGEKSLAVVCTADYLTNWDKLSDFEYKEQKKIIAENIVNDLDKQYPGLKESIEYLEVATAKTIKKYTLNPEGTAYGYAQTPSQAGILRPSVKSPLKGLYFASAWSFPGGGFTGVILSGKMCVEKI